MLCVFSLVTLTKLDLGASISRTGHQGGSRNRFPADPWVDMKAAAPVPLTYIACGSKLKRNKVMAGSSHWFHLKKSVIFWYMLLSHSLIGLGDRGNHALLFAYTNGRAQPPQKVKD